MRHDLTNLFQSLRAKSKEPGDLSDILNRIAKTAKEYFSPDLCVIFPMNPITGLFLREPPIHKGKIINPQVKFEYPSKGGLTKTILKNKTQAIENLAGKYSSPKVEAEKIISVIGTGLYTKRHDKPLAVMYLDYRKAKKFSDAFINDLKLFAELASSELQSTWFIRRYREIAKIGQDINENFENIQQMFESVFEHIKGILDVSFYFSLATYDFRKNKADLYLVDKGNHTTRYDYSLRKSSATSWVLRNLQVITSGNFRKGDLPAGVKVFHVAKTASMESSGIFVPIKIGIKPLGVLSIQHSKENYYDDEDRQILELLANHIALALNNYRLLNDLRELDSSGQVLTAELDPSIDIIDEVADRIYEATQADLITLYPYQQSKEKYLLPIHRGKFYNPQSTLRMGEATPAAIVHKVGQHAIPIFAVKSPELYTKLEKKYQEGGRFPDAEKIKSTAALPLKAGVESIGVLFINYRSEQQFDPAQQWVIRSLATYAAIAIRNSRLFLSLRDRRLSELEDLRKIDQAISSKFLNSDDILKTILDLSAKYIQADTGLVLLHNKKLNALEPKAIIGDIEPTNQDLIVALDKSEGIANVAFKEKRTIRISNVRKDPEWSRTFIEVAKNTISEMDIPLILGGTPIGVMNFESSKEAAFSDDDQQFMETLAGQAVIVVSNAIEFERTQRIAIQRKALIDTVNNLLSIDNQEKLFSTILRQALDITETTKGTISLSDERKREIRIVAKENLKEGWPLIQSFDDGVVGLSVREKKIINIDNVSTHPLKQLFIDAFPGDEVSELVVPIFDDDKVIGVINLESEKPYHYEEDDVELVQSLASLCTVAIKNAENIEQKRLVFVGFITGDLSHKMKSPLSKIQRQIELIEMNKESVFKKHPETADHFNRIKEISSKATTMVQNTLDEAKKMLVSLEKISLNDMIKSAISDIEIPASISINNSFGVNNIEYYVTATKHLKNVFHTLITNSIDAIESAEGKIFIDVENADEDWVIISVEDTGKGISAADAELALLPISSTGLGGRGFGLALTNQYIEMIGGKLVAPKPGRNGNGAKFLLHLKRYNLQ